jgi:hypothetical protein
MYHITFLISSIPLPGMMGIRPDVYVWDKLHVGLWAVLYLGDTASRWRAAIGSRLDSKTHNLD